MDVQEQNTDAMTIRYRVTADDVATFLEYRSLNRIQKLPKQWVQHIGFSLWCALGAFLIILAPQNTANRDFSFAHEFWAYTIPPCVFSVVLFIKRKEIPSRVRRAALLTIESGTFDNMIGSITLELAADGITHASLSKPRTFAWNRIEKVDRLSTGAICIHFSNQNSLFVPAHAFADQKESQAFHTYAIRYLRKAYGQNFPES